MEKWLRIWLVEKILEEKHLQQGWSIRKLDILRRRLRCWNPTMDKLRTCHNENEVRSCRCMAKIQTDQKRIPTNAIAPYIQRIMVGTTMVHVTTSDNRQGSCHVFQVFHRRCSSNISWEGNLISDSFWLLSSQSSRFELSSSWKRSSPLEEDEGGISVNSISSSSSL